MDIDLQKEIDNAPFGKVQFWILLLCACIAALDGLDFQVISYTAPLMAKELGIPVSALGWVFGAGVGGMALGPFLIAPLGDYLGRRTTLASCLVFFGALVFVTPWAESFWALILVRFLTGLGIGGAMPNALALASEYAPSRHRSLAVTLTYIGFAVGGAGGGVIASALIGRFGWQSVFYLCGLAPFLFGLFLPLLLPESLQFTVRQGRAGDRWVGRQLGRLNPQTVYAPDASFVLNEPRLGNSMVDLFRDGRARNTLLLWAALFLNILGVFAVINWGPTLFNQAGAGLDQAIWITVWFWLGGIAGSLLLVWLSPRLGSRVTLAAYLVVGAACVAAIGVGSTDSVFILVMTSLAGFAACGAQIGFYPVLANVYPASIRVTGIGWAQGWGRTGAIVGPIVIGLLVAANWPFAGYFLVMALPILCSGLVVLLLDHP